MLDFNTEPYNDDFDENDKFYRILFRPSFAVQARELTQLQTILQNQIKRQGDHIFKQGAMVIPGQIAVDTKFAYVKVQALYNGNVVETYINNFEGQRIVGTSGIEAEVLKVQNAENSDATTLYVRYITSGDDTVTKTFADNEVISTADSVYSVQALAADSTGVGSAAIIQRGVYYINGFFVLCDAQTIILDKYTNTPSYRIGLLVNEVNVTPEDAGYEKLLDNAQNSYNYAAPGAHRYYIDLILSKVSLTSVDDTDFVELVRIENGETKREVRATEYAVLEDTLARRTFDESGNYTVKPFEIDVREYRNNNRDAWASNRVYLIGDVVTNAGKTYVAKNSGTSLTTAPTHTSGNAYDGPGNTGIQWEYNESPFYNRGIYTPSNTATLVENNAMEAQLAIGLEPGKAYVRGYEIEKIATEYVAIDKAREFVQTDNSIVSATVGNYVLVTNVNSMPKFDNFDTIGLYDRVTGAAGRGTAVGTQIGTARVRGIEWHNGTIGSNTAIYKLFLFDVKLNNGFNFNRNVKSFYYNNAAGGAVKDFSADISPISTQLIGSVSQSTTTVTGSGTSFQTDLVVGDYIYVGTTLSRVVSIASQQSLTVDTSATQTGVTVGLATTQVYEPNNSSLIFPLPYSTIKSVRSSTGTNDTSYSVMERFAGTTTSGGTLTVSTGSGTMASAAETDNYLCVDDTTGNIVLPTSISPSGSSVTFEFGAGYGSRAFIVMGTVNKTGSSGTEKTKTLNSATVAFTTQATATAKTLSLGKADCFRVVSVKMKSGTFASPGATYSIDITDRYDFDDGQRDSFYDYGRIVLKSSFAPPSAPIEVSFEFFSHSTGDYFTVNSYPANVAYKDIPYFNRIPLRDAFDFRPRIDDAGATFSGTGSSTTLLPKRGIDIRSDFTYYLGRKDKIAIDFNGNFFDIKGVSSLNPGEPLDAKLSMVLYTINLAPYTFSTETTSVYPTKIDNRRFTMRDIGKLEKRIENLEYYTSLSLLEQQTENLTIRDADGLDRFKNGFIVDNFTGHNIGNVDSPDYVCSIDMEAGELRPFFSMKNVNLIEKNSSDGARASSNYKLYGDVITLPLDSVTPHVAMISQPYASRTEFVNPYSIFTFIGDVKVNPSSDDWFEVDRRPDIIRNEEGNFNIISTLAEKAGVLGTVWNSWQNQWVGASSTSSTSSSSFNLRDGWTWLDTTTIETTARQVGQTRTGIRTNVVAKIDTRTVDDRVLSTAVIPYIRSRNILIQTKKLKPNTRFYAFFDDVAISEYCTPATKITYTAATGVFDESTNVGGLAAETARRINGDSQVCLNRGDVINGFTSGATAVVVGTEFDSDTNTYALYVQNVIGTFSPSEVISGSISGATATVGTITPASLGGNLVSNLNGDLHLLFNIPNTEEIRFRTGTREFKLVDVSTADGEYTSRGRTNYSASGILETRQSTVVATRNAELVEEALTDSRTIVESSQRIVSDTQWYDPLAQTFLVQQKGGAFLSKVDVYFAAKDDKVPVSIEIREVVNGYPGKRILPFSRVTIKPEQVSLSTNTVTLDGVSVPSYDTATTFNFPSPVYVQDNTEYCLVLLSDSDKYKVWIAQMGDSIPGSNRTISEQPYAGVLFKSQNASTWTADQTQDLKFTIWRAKFDTSVSASVQFVNDVVPFSDLDVNPVETKTGTNVVRIWQANHGMPVGSSVTLTDYDSTRLTGATATGTITTSLSSATVTGVGTSFSSTVSVGTVLFSTAGTYIGIVSSIASNTSLTLSANAAVALAAGSSFKIAAPVNGIPVSQLYSTHTISNVDLDSYTITVANNATSNGYSGGNTIRASQNIQYDAVQPIVQVQTFSDTKTDFAIKTTSGKSVDGSQTAYVADSGFGAVLANENNYFYTPRVIASEVNENTFLGGNKSITMSVNMTSSNDSLSPILDTHRMSLVTISNKVNAPTETNMNVAALDLTSLFTGATGAFSFSGSTITSTNATIRGLMPSILVGTYITIAGATTSANNGTYLVTSVVDNGTTGTVTVSGVTFTSESAVSGTSLTTRSLYFDEIAPVGSSTFSKYVSKKINLSNPSSFLRVRLAANIPSESDVLVYYRTSPVGSSVNLDTVNWVLFNPDSTIPKVENGNDSFFDVDYSMDNLAPFDAMAIKLVMKSTNTSAIPRIKDLRIIACA